MPSPSRPPDPADEASRGLAPELVKASPAPSEYLTLRETAHVIGCSESTLRRLVKTSDIPALQQETASGFRYLVRREHIPLVAHKATMRRPRGRRAEGQTLQPSSVEALQEASGAREELAAVKAERDLLRAENMRLWTQLDRLTESVSRLALPARREEESAPSEAPGGWRRFADWFLGRGS
jgi:hypothetical protein